MARLLEELQQIASGSVIYDKLAQILQDWHDARTRLDRAYSVLISFMLDTYLQDPTHSKALEISAKLDQLGLAGAGSTEATKPKHDNSADVPASHRDFEEKLNSLVRNLKERNQKSRSPGERNAEEQHPVGEHRQNGQALYNGEANHKIKRHPAVERRVDSAYRLHLDRKHDEIAKFQEALSQKASEAIAQNKEFGALLEIELSALEQANDIDEIQNLKQILIGGTKELLKGQGNLAEKLRSSKDFLELVKTDSASLRDELDKVRLLSLTDEYTNLPNRRAFMRRLEDEIGRAQRYQTPLALAIIDLDKFKAINDKYGHAAGDEVLRWYAQNVLSIFRHHDMVARYGGEEFAVLLPNTNDEGALRALNKVKGRAANATWDYDGGVLPAPTFSAGLTLYVPGEPPTSLIDRADKALYRAKRLGRNRIETELSKIAVLDDLENHNS